MEQKNENYGYVNKNQFTISIIFLLVITVTLFVSAYLLLSNKIDQALTVEINSETPTFNEIKTEETEKVQYLLKEYNGKLAVYKNNDFQYELDIYVFTLPEEDKKLLSKGISASSEQELNDIISSYY